MAAVVTARAVARVPRVWGRFWRGGEGNGDWGFADLESRGAQGGRRAECDLRFKTGP